MNARETLEAYLSAWQRHAWYEMSACMQKTARIYGWGPGKLRDMYDLELNGFSVINEKVVSDACHHIKVRLKFPRGKKVTVLANVICESRPNEPNPLGQWGVNPHSVLRFR